MAQTETKPNPSSFHILNQISWTYARQHFLIGEKLRANFYRTQLRKSYVPVYPYSTDTDITDIWSSLDKADISIAYYMATVGFKYAYLEEIIE